MVLFWNSAPQRCYKFNTFLLEREFGWKGVLAEPSEQWHSDLKKNRPNATIVTECIYSESGLTLDFFVSAAGELSTLEDFRQSDQKHAWQHSKQK